METPINDELAATLDWAPSAEATIEDARLPRSIPTPATENAPRGRIIDDSARGTIFWEAESLEDEPDAPRPEGADETERTGDDGARESKPNLAEGSSVVGPENPTLSQAFGKPFKVKWLSTNRLPFYRTRGLRNPWNANREVKIARDGTELETSVGRRLIEMFDRPPPGPGSVQQPAPRGPPQMGSYPIPPF
jgi:hypothetical protein